jgi:hypothetical protein
VQLPDAAVPTGVLPIADGRAFPWANGLCEMLGWHADVWEAEKTFALDVNAAMKTGIDRYNAAAPEPDFVYSPKEEGHVFKRVMPHDPNIQCRAACAVLKRRGEAYNGLRRILCVTTHLAGSPHEDGPACQALQALALRHEVGEIARAEKVDVVVVGGDFNAGPESSAFRAFTGEWQRANATPENPVAKSYDVVSGRVCTRLANIATWIEHAFPGAKPVAKDEARGGLGVMHSAYASAGVDAKTSWMFSSSSKPECVDHIFAGVCHPAHASSDPDQKRATSANDDPDQKPATSANDKGPIIRGVAAMQVLDMSAADRRDTDKAQGKGVADQGGWPDSIHPSDHIPIAAILGVIVPLSAKQRKKLEKQQGAQKKPASRNRGRRGKGKTGNNKVEGQGAGEGEGKVQSNK